ncbi:hypothetical protein C8244_14830 [Paracidovorax avenae]|uniref:rolling circle replication-associated protein n=1 Tax=Paracidovorax avenae TaxID=80867 RepID=UPI000D171F05|nr:hypothetical protein [Paracidovorax avenae]AVT17351.1 hypothetical protein C8244_14830 [Paracidovorax avenae]
MIRIVDESNPEAKRSPEDLLAMHIAGHALAVFEGKTGDGLRVKAHDLGNGHTEVTASAPTVWVEQDWSPLALEMYLECVIKNREENADELREKSLTIAANRAKSKVRKLCKAMGADTMLTLTYRANFRDLAQSKKHLKEFVRRVRRVMPSFRAVAVYEHQERGALHWHIATAGVPAAFMQANAVGVQSKVKSFDVLRAIWRSVAKDLGGNVDVARRKASSRKSPAQIAAYIAKYIVKAFRSGEAFSNRYTAFGDFNIPQPVDLGLFPTASAALAACYDVLLDVQRVVLAKMSRWQDWFVLYAETPKKRPSGLVVG